MDAFVRSESYFVDLFVHAFVPAFGSEIVPDNLEFVHKIVPEFVLAFSKFVIAVVLAFMLAFSEFVIAFVLALRARIALDNSSFVDVFGEFVAVFVHAFVDAFVDASLNVSIDRFPRRVLFELSKIIRRGS